MLQFPVLSEDCNISHFVTTRQGGVSKGAYASFNPGEYSGDNPEAVRANRKLLSDAIRIPSERIFAPFQVHGAEVRSIEPSFLSLPLEEQQLYMHGVDALVTDVPEVCIAVSTADCVPVLLYAPDVKAVAAVHAGWRGTVLRIAGKTVRILMDEYGADPRLMKAGIAPSIGPEAFEVGEEVVDAFREAGFEMSCILKRDADTGKAHIDLWEANRLQLLTEGLSGRKYRTSRNLYLRPSRRVFLRPSSGNQKRAYPVRYFLAWFLPVYTIKDYSKMDAFHQILVDHHMSS